MNIRLVRTTDAGLLLAIYAPVVRNTVISFEAEVPSEHEIQQRIEQTVLRWPWLVCTDGEAITGYAYASAHRKRAAYQWSADVSAYVHPDHHRRGIGSALYTALFALLVQLGYFNAYAAITLPNPASVGLHESLGFEPVGVYRQVGYKFGAWHDVGWWGLDLQPRTDDPAPPRPVTEILNTPAWDAAIRQGEQRIK